jgi:hypothetical protein
MDMNEHLLRFLENWKYSDFEEGKLLLMNYVEVMMVV